MVADEREERRPPGRDRVEQRELREVATLEQVRAQRDRAADVVCCDRGAVEAPVGEQLAEHQRLRGGTRPDARQDARRLPAGGYPVTAVTSGR
jgi:hypothetical protein